MWRMLFMMVALSMSAVPAAHAQETLSCGDYLNMVQSGNDTSINEYVQNMWERLNETRVANGNSPEAFNSSSRDFIERFCSSDQYQPLQMAVMNAYSMDVRIDNTLR